MYGHYPKKRVHRQVLPGPSGAQVRKPSAVPKEPGQKPPAAGAVLLPVEKQAVYMPEQELRQGEKRMRAESEQWLSLIHI